jgi:hypothetical protein
MDGTWTRIRRPSHGQRPDRAQATCGILSMRRLVSVAAIAAVVAAAAACGGSGSTTSPSSPTPSPTPTPSLGWTFTAEGGVRASCTVPAITALTPANVLLFCGNVYQSSDGLSFSQISPVTSSFPNGVHEASIVPDAAGGYRLYYVSDQSPNGGQSALALYVATSTDGLNWTSGTALPYTPPNLGNVDVVAVPGGYRAYYNASPAGDIDSAFSSDGVTFADEGVRIHAGAVGWWQASVVDMGGLGWLMAVNTSFHMGLDDIVLATSTDGLTWTTDTGPILSSAQGTSYRAPNLVAVSATTARLYYLTGLTGSSAIMSGTVSHASGATTSVLPFAGSAPIGGAVHTPQPAHAPSTVHVPQSDDHAGPQAQPAGRSRRSGA